MRPHSAFLEGHLRSPRTVTVQRLSTPTNQEPRTTPHRPSVTGAFEITVRCLNCGAVLPSYKAWLRHRAAARHEDAEEHGEYEEQRTLLERRVCNCGKPMRYVRNLWRCDCGFLETDSGEPVEYGRELHVHQYDSRWVCSGCGCRVFCILPPMKRLAGIVTPASLKRPY
jgi:hypothetical protein